MMEGIQEVFDACGIASDPPTGSQKNANASRGKYQPNKEQIKKIEEIYGKDFELYEQL